MGRARVTVLFLILEGVWKIMNEGEARPDEAQEIPESVCVLASGGADSSILLAHLAARTARVVPVYVRNGLAWEEAELHWLGKFVRKLEHPSIRPIEVLDLPMGDVYGSHWSMTGRDVPDDLSEWNEVYLPGRNLILLAKTAVFASIRDIRAIALGPLKTNLFSDSSPSFFSGMGRMIETALEYPVRILTPFADRTKNDVMLLGKDLPLELTFSCLNPQGNSHCGMCNKCAERRLAFSEAGLADPTR
ncbi:MAG TPA: 7-cyano-7-deazaguanine synthase, partial [Nitrospiria bacterium]|nr:7-cyano-7-deazaguanine synthase [Nitrospiria bacterium]